MQEHIIVIRDFFLTYGLYIQAIALFLYMAKARTLTAFAYCVALLLIFTSVHFYMEKHLTVMAQDPSLQLLVRNLWYLGFAYTHAFLVLLVLVICRRKALVIDRISKLVLTSCVALALLQIARYIDRVINNTDYLGLIYSVMLPSLNIAITTLICIAAISVYMGANKKAVYVDSTAK
jgi:hypothetical protein